MRLIDVDKFEVVGGNVPVRYDVASYLAGCKEILEMIDAAPTIDAVQVVRCKDCRYKDRITAPKGYIYCTRLDICASGDGFCHKGEMMRGDTDASN